jgi:hypothetical protein
MHQVGDKITKDDFNTQLIEWCTSLGTEIHVVYKRRDRRTMAGHPQRTDRVYRLEHVATDDVE